MNDFDKACRELLLADPAGVVRRLLEVKPGLLSFVRLLDTRNPPRQGEPEGICDTVVVLRDEAAGGVPWVLPLEFQIDPDFDIVSRGLIYMGSLRRGYSPTPLPGDRYHVGMIVVNLRGKGAASVDMTLSGTVVRTGLWLCEVNLSGWKARHLLDEIVSGAASQALAAWIPLCIGGGDPVIMRDWRAFIDTVKDARFRSVFALAEVFAEAVDLRPQWAECLRGYDAMESVTANRWRAEGETVGEARGKAAALVRYLSRWNPPEALTSAIRAVTDIPRLDALTDIAFAAPSLDEFRRVAGL